MTTEQEREIANQLDAIDRSVTIGPGEAGVGPWVVQRISRIYRTDVDDLWDAVTNPERLPRFFAPVEGDFRLGGRYQVQGNAGGTIEKCEPPHLFEVTWEFGEGKSFVLVTIEAAGAEQRQTDARASRRGARRILDALWTRRDRRGVGSELLRIGGLHREGRGAWLAGRCVVRDRRGQDSASTVRARAGQMSRLRPVSRKRRPARPRLQRQRSSKARAERCCADEMIQIAVRCAAFEEC